MDATPPARSATPVHITLHQATSTGDETEYADAATDTGCIVSDKGVPAIAACCDAATDYDPPPLEDPLSSDDVSAPSDFEISFSGHHSEPDAGVVVYPTEEASRDVSLSEHHTMRTVHATSEGSPVAT